MDKKEIRKKGHEVLDEAGDLRRSGAPVAAGNHYTAAAHIYAGGVTEHTFPEPDLTRSALSTLCRAATCYRIAGDDFRVQNRCDIGVLLAEDYLEYIETEYMGNEDIEPYWFAEIRVGAWHEFIGDLRTIAERDDADEAYEQAKAIYESVGEGEAEFCMGEQEHTRLAAFFRKVREAVGSDISTASIEYQPLGPTFVDWIEYKRELLPELLDELEQIGRWEKNEQVPREPKSTPREINLTNLNDSKHDDPCILRTETDIESTNTQHLSDVSVGDMLYIKPRSGLSHVVDDIGRIIGQIDPSLSRHLVDCMEGGYSYRARIVSIDGEECRVKVGNDCNQEDGDK